MNIEKITIKNYKCFSNKSINLSVPDGTPGSGLTIFIGENGTGKTATLEAINYLTQSKYVTENKIDINEFQDFKEPITIEAKTSIYTCASSIDYYKRGNWYFSCTGILFEAKSRDIKAPGKLFSTPYKIKSHFRTSSDYIKADGSGADKPVDSRDLSFNNGAIREDELNIFYFDKNRTRQITTGNYKTTLERALDDLNWRFLKNVDSSVESKLVDNISGEYFKTVERTLSSSPFSKLGESLKDFFDNDEYADLKLDLLNILHPYKNASPVIRREDQITQKYVRNLGSGVEMILTLLMLQAAANASKGSIIYLIDEPELHLHPKAQEKLLELLIEESSKKQIIISTHSPYMFQGIFSTSANLYITTKKEDGSIDFENAADSGWGIFESNSPTWGEINYFAYKLPTIEFHNELYGFLQARATDKDDKNEKCKDFDEYLKENGSPIDIDWVHEKAIGNAEYKVTLQTYVRNCIHHPENKKNKHYSSDQLKKSTDMLIEILNSKK